MITTKRASDPNRVLIRSATTASRRLQLALERQQIFVSNMPLSFIPFAQLKKAFQLHGAVLALCKTGFGSEAYALSRTLIEVFIALRWITNRDQDTRSKEFGFFEAKRKEYWATILERYHPNHPQSAGAIKYVKGLYGDYAAKYKSFVFWSNVEQKLKGMAKEPEGLDHDAASDSLWDYEVPYSMASDYVHATVVGIGEHITASGECSSISQASDPGLAQNAIVTATMWLFKIMIRVNIARQLEMKSEIDKAFGPFARLVESLPARPR